MDKQEDNQTKLIGTPVCSYVRMMWRFEQRTFTQTIGYNSGESAKEDSDNSSFEPERKYTPNPALDLPNVKAHIRVQLVRRRED